MNTSFGYNQNDHNWVDAKEIVFRLVDIVSKGGNYLLNVGPTSEGLIPQPCIERLMEVGAWMETNGEAIYGTSPWRVFRDGSPLDKEAGKAPRRSPGTPVDVRFTAKGNSIYAICMAWPEKEVRVRALGRSAVPAKSIAAARMLGSSDEVKWRQDDDALTLSVPWEQPCRHAFVYRIDFKQEREKDAAPAAGGARRSPSIGRPAAGPTRCRGWWAPSRRSANGFSVDQSVRLEAGDPQGVQRLIEYFLRSLQSGPND